MLIYSSNITIFSINCVQFNILFELDIFVASRLFNMSKTLYYKTVRINVRENQWEINNVHTREIGNIGYLRHTTKTNYSKTQHNMLWTPLQVLEPTLQYTGNPHLNHYYTVFFL
jgi:hypothetical protein